MDICEWEKLLLFFREFMAFTSFFTVTLDYLNFSITILLLVIVVNKHR